MKSVEKNTPTSAKVDKNQSGKKLVQARLPFKVISSTATGPGTPPSITKAVSSNESIEKKKNDTPKGGNMPKKRKLSYSDDSDIRGPKKVACKDVESDSKENEVVVLSDDEDKGAGHDGEQNSMTISTCESLNPFVRLENIDVMINSLKNDRTGRIILSPRTPKQQKKNVPKVSVQVS